MASSDLQNLPALRTPPRWRVLTPARARAPWLTFMLIGLMAANVGLYVLTVAQEASLNRDQAKIYDQREENIRLGAKLAAFEAPDRIESLAISQLHLIYPTDALFLPSPPPTMVRTPHVALLAFGVPEAY